MRIQGTVRISRKQFNLQLIFKFFDFILFHQRTKIIFSFKVTEKRRQNVISFHQPVACQQKELLMGLEPMLAPRRDDSGSRSHHFFNAGRL